MTGRRPARRGRPPPGGGGAHRRSDRRPAIARPRPAEFALETAAAVAWTADRSPLRSVHPDRAAGGPGNARTEERRAGKERVSNCRYRVSRYHYTNNLI